jgi:regulator of RNase E activity RraA
MRDHPPPRFVAREGHGHVPNVTLNLVNNAALASAFASVSTANLADACIRRGVAMSLTPSSVRPLVPGSRFCGRALPVTHFGSVDVFLEALDFAEAGDVLVIDNTNRQDEGCIGDLTVMEARTAGIAGIVLWGAHRDTTELLDLGVPVLSTGAFPAGPRHARPRTRQPLEPCDVGGASVTRDDVVFADDDGALWFPLEHAPILLAAAAEIRETESRQADAVRRGVTLRDQFHWARYLEIRKTRPEYTLREHLQSVNAAIEV